MQVILAHWGLLFPTTSARLLPTIVLAEPCHGPGMRVLGPRHYADAGWRRFWADRSRPECLRLPKPLLAKLMHAFVGVVFCPIGAIFSSRVAAEAHSPCPAWIRLRRSMERDLHKSPRGR